MNKINCALLLFAILFIANYRLLKAQSLKSNPNAIVLTARQQSLIMIAALTANGNLEKLKGAQHASLDAGMTINEVKEVLVHVYAYCGFPRSIRGIMTLMSVLEERKAKGINDLLGKTASPLPAEVDKYELGKQTLAKLSGQPAGGVAGYGAFSPEIDRFLKEHLFADIFSRDVLSYLDREIATVSALISISGVEPMLQSHIRIAMYQGLTDSQMKELLVKVEGAVGQPELEAAKKVYNEITTSKK